MNFAQSMGPASPNVAWAIRTRDLHVAEEMLRRQAFPFRTKGLMIPIVSSAVAVCSLPIRMSASARPRHGRIKP